MAKAPKKTVTGRVLHDPVKDKLRPIFPIDLSKCRTIDQLVRAMADTAFTGRQIGDAADVLEAMARDKDCFVVMTLSGALTVGKMGLIFCDLIESGIAPSTPCVAVSKATTPEQHITITTIENLGEAEIGPAPVLLLIGHAIHIPAKPDER